MLKNMSEIERSLEFHFNKTLSENWYAALDASFWLSTIIFAFGVIGNILTILLISCLRRLNKSPTYIAIACLSFSDLVGIIMNYVHICVQPLESIQTFPAKIVGGKLYMTSAAISTLHVSLSHVIMFAVLRYVIIVHPLWSRRYLKRKIVLVTSVCLWVYGFGYGLIHTHWVKKKARNYSGATEVIITDRIFEIIVPLVLLSVFHGLKIRHLRRSNMGNVLAHAKKMFRMTLIIALTYFITMVPLWTTIILLFTVGFHSMPEYGYVFLVISYPIYLLNFALDPVIYFVFTPVFRQHITDLLGLSKRGRQASFINFSIDDSRRQMDKYIADASNTGLSAAEPLNSIEQEVARACKSPATVPLRQIISEPHSSNV